MPSGRVGVPLAGLVSAEEIALAKRDWLFTLIAWPERTVDAALAAILNSTTPIFAFLLTVLITHTNQ
ncbi:hypothetical protein GGD56_000460 [Rhizobium mongolense]|uniref:Uncharacterized protein n=1 Tax=Rhizobium mongolense TaxID=57676 RepID=A0ABR6IFW1_9HYPH|nr:hypothetical protein [Rhizobium mongolense]